MVLSKGGAVFFGSIQEKPGITIFFSEKADLRELNEMLTDECFGGGQDPVGEDRLLTLPLGGYATGMGGITFWCYRLPSKNHNLYQKPAFPFSAGYGDVIWVKSIDEDEKILWQNCDYNEDGTPKKAEEEPQ